LEFGLDHHAAIAVHIAVGRRDRAGAGTLDDDEAGAVIAHNAVGHFGDDLAL
jgi:hypothetical protein